MNKKNLPNSNQNQTITFNFDLNSDQGKNYEFYYPHNNMKCVLEKFKKDFVEKGKLFKNFIASRREKKHYINKNKFHELNIF